MEYLTLQDIPHRHCNPVHSHRMASQSSERPVGHMAAVCDTFSSHCPPSSTPPLALLPPHQPLIYYAYAPRDHRSIERDLIERKGPPEPLQQIVLPRLLPSSSPLPTSVPQDAGDLEFRVALKGDTDPSKHVNLHSAHLEVDTRTKKHFLSWLDTKTSSQTHLQRNSPPLQPGEQNFPGKLPSFDEVSNSQSCGLL